MTDERTFLDALAADPFDDNTRSAYADWLERRGDPRGEYLRIEIAQAHAVIDSVPYLKHNHALNRLRGEFDPAWLDAAASPYDVWLIRFKPGARPALVRAVSALLGEEASADEAGRLLDATPCAVVTERPYSVARSAWQALLACCGPNGWDPRREVIAVKRLSRRPGRERVGSVNAAPPVLHDRRDTP